VIRPVRVLLLGGSTEAAVLARALGPIAGYEVTVSYAGRTKRRVQTPGMVRVGGFGGAAGLAHHLTTEAVDVVVDATHPFAAHMPGHAAGACSATGVPRLRLCRPPWAAVPDDRWLEVDDLDAAAARLEQLAARRVFLTTGRQDLEPFARLRDTWFLVRAIEAPEWMPLANAELVLARGPFAEPSELDLMTRHRVDALVTKNSGGTAAAPKLAAARALDLSVVMVARPPVPPGPHAATVDEAIAWLTELTGFAVVGTPFPQEDEEGTTAGSASGASAG
jgi:precorrin-6A/cobalt-precorrin-6A reductase